MPVRILYIDDDPALARLAEKVLARHQFDVVHAPSVKAGLDAFDSDEFDAVVLDHYFQDRTGLDFLEAIGERARLVPVLYVTGSSDAQIAISALKGGAADYVIKTVADDFFPLLVSAIGQALENVRLRRAKQEADDLLLAAKERAELLVAEMNHRIANSLSLVSALLRMQMQTVSGDEAKTALAETRNRISAIAGVHRSLYTADSVGTVELSHYLQSLISEVRSTGGAAAGISIATSFGPVQVTADRAVSIGVIVTELVTNALKYAYPGGEGEVRVSLARGDDGIIVLAVEDDGTGFDPEATLPKGTGLGTRILKAMALNLNATLDWRQGGKGSCISIRWEG